MHHTPLLPNPRASIYYNPHSHHDTMHASTTQKRPQSTSETPRISVFPFPRTWKSSAKSSVYAPYLSPFFALAMIPRMCSTILLASSDEQFCGEGEGTTAIASGALIVPAVRTKTAFRCSLADLIPG